MVCSLSLADFQQQVLVCFLLHLRQHHPFRHLSNFGAVRLLEKVSEVVPSFLPFLFGSCLNAHESPHEHWPTVIQRMEPPLSELCLACSLPFPFDCPLLGAPIAGLSWPRFLALKSARDVFEPSTSTCNSHSSCRRLSSLGCRHVTQISTLATFQFASCTGPPTCCQ